jgi:hypothetical protein
VSASTKNGLRAALALGPRPRLNTDAWLGERAFRGRLLDPLPLGGLSWGPRAIFDDLDEDARAFAAAVEERARLGAPRAGRRQDAEQAGASAAEALWAEVARRGLPREAALTALFTRVVELTRGEHEHAERASALLLTEEET